MKKPHIILALLSLSTVVTSAPTKSKPTSSSITVSVEGDVLKPGLYEVKSGADLQDALVLAGGLAIRPTSARVTVERGPNKKLSFSAPTLFPNKPDPKAKQNPRVSIKLEANDYIRVDTQPLNRPDPIMAFMAERKATVGAWPPESSSFQFNGITVYVIPLPGPNSSKQNNNR
jgi:hypothetical protein